MKSRRFLLASAATLAVALWQLPVLFAAGASAGDDSSAAREGFRSDGSTYVSVASARGSSAEGAEKLARGAALRGLFDGLGKDRLFAEVFTASPPLSLSIQLVSASKEGFGFKALVRLQIDDESVRIVERGPYLAAAIGILDKAETQSDEAEARREKAAEAETQAALGTALGQYGMAIDACHGALQLVDPVADPSLFSTKGKRTAPELKKILASILADASAGVERVDKAQASLAADESSAEVARVADAAIAEADKAQALLDEMAPILGNVSSYGEEQLAPMRDRISSQRRSLGDSKAALERVRAALPQERDSSAANANAPSFANANAPSFANANAPSFANANAPSFAKDKLAFARRRLDTADAALAAAFRTVDRELRDPAARREARAQAISWAFLHEPREYLSLRGYLPFSLSSGKQGLAAAPFDLDADLEGAFALGGGGVWVRSRAQLASTDLEPGQSGGDELAFAQGFDFGVWSKGLFFAGYTWDWLRRVDGAPFPKAGAVELGMGGVYEHGSPNDRFRRADWLISVSYELPYATEDFLQWNVFNAGIEAQFRLGQIAVLEASAAKRLDEVSDRPSPRYVSVLRWAIGIGLRLPPPFAIGVEYFGAYVQPLEADGSPGVAADFDGGRFRFFLQYSI